MKNRLKYLFLLLFVVVIGGCFSCSPRGGEAPIYDFVSRDLVFDIVDGHGRSLINPDTPWGDQRLKSIVFTMDGEEYRYEGKSAGELRAIPEFYRGVHLKKDKSDYCLTFGEFQPHYKDQKVTMNIPGVGVYNIVFDYYVREKMINDISAEGAVELNGEPYSGDPLYNDPFRIRIEVDEEQWADYESDLGEDLPKYLPVTLYFFPSGSASDSYDSWTKEKELWVNYGGNRYNYQVVPEGVDPIYVEEPFFYGGRSSFLLPDYAHPLDYLAFGPFDPGENLEEEKIDLNYKGTLYNITFTAKLDPEGNVIYDATLADTQNDPDLGKKLYFRNGPLIYLPR